MLDFAFIRDNWLYIALGLGDTLGIALISLFIAIPLAVLVAKGRRSKVMLFKALSAFYVSLLDGIPLLIQIPFVFLALPQKDSTLVSLSGFIHDVYWRAQQVGRPQFKNLEALVVAAVIYLIVNTLMSYGFRVRRFARAG